MSEEGRVRKAEDRLRGLFVRALAGEEAAYREFLAGLGAHLRGFLRRRLERLPDDIEDLVQETLLAVHIQRHTYDAGQPLTAWVHAIARYKLVDLLRRRAARAALEQARVDLERTVLRAPIDGVVSQRRVQVGQKVQAGTQLMVVVPVQAAYVDANFKEVELKKVKPGQPVELISDLYGEDVVFHGKVAGFSGGTGAAFALVPAQNATGNWIKVVQRLPVRVTLDPKELRKHPLRVGLSMEVDINVAN